MIMYNEQQMQDAYYRVKSSIDAWRGSAGYANYNASTLAQLYAMSPYMFTAGNVRAQAISRLKFKVYDGEDVLPDIHPLQALLNSNNDFADLMTRVELSMSFFGWSLLFVTRSYTNRPLGLTWVNPTTVQRDVLSNGGLDGFRVYSHGVNNADLKDLVNDGYIPLRNALYFNGVDFFDDYDGVAPAESAFRSVMASVEIDETTLAIFKNGAIPPLAIQPTADAMQQVELAGQGDKGIVAGLINNLQRLFKGASNQGKVLVSPTRWEYHPLQPAFKDMNTANIDMGLAKKISASFQVPLSLILPSEVTSGLSRNEDGRDWAYSWIQPRGHWYASKMTERLASHYGSQFSIRLDEDSVPFLQPTPEEKNKIVESRVNMGVLSLQSAQEVLEGKVDELLGEEPLYKVGDDWVKASLVANWGVYKLQVAPSTTLGGIFPNDIVPYDPSVNEQAIQQQYAEAAVLNAESQAEESEAEVEATEAEADVLEEEAELVEAETEQVEDDIEDETTKRHVPYEWYQEVDTYKNYIRKRGFSKAKGTFDFEYIPANVIRFIDATYDESNPDNDVFAKARERLAYKAIQATRLDYEADVERLLGRALNGGMTEAVFRDRMRAIHRRYMPLAYEDGLIDGGVPDGDMTGSDRAIINRFITSQTPYIRNLARTLYADDNQITEDEIRGKPAMWFNKSIYPAYLKGKASAGKNANFEWVMGNTEHCADCKRLNGQVHRMSSWERKGWIPKSDKLECGGFNCKCDLVKVDRRARGNW